MTRGGVSKRPFGWLDEITGWRRSKSSPRAIEVIEVIEAMEVPTSELRAWRSQADRYGRFRPGLVAEIERRCWALSRPR